MSSADSAGTVMVPGFHHIPGHHCGSTALRNLLAHHGAEISEELAFGLGAGACFFYISHDDLSPSRFTNGRTGRLEEQLPRADRRGAASCGPPRSRTLRGRWRGS